MKKVALTLMAASMVLLSGCGQKVKIDKSEPVIKVNDAIITKNKIDEAIIKESKPLGRLDKNKPDDSFMYLVYKNKVINDVIIMELLRQEEEKRNITVSDEEVNAKIDEIIEKIGGRAKFEAYFINNKESKEDFKEKLKTDMLSEKLAADLLGSDAVSEKEVKNFYNKNLDKHFKHPEQVKASHILISAVEPMIRAKIQSESNSGKKLSSQEIDKKVIEELNKAKNKAEKILAEVKANPEKFAEIAKKESQDPSSAERGGDLGFFSKDKMVPSFSNAAFNTKPGEISGLVKTEYGYHIIKVTDRKKAGVTPYDEVKDLIKKYLTDQKKMEALQKLLVGLKNKAKVEFINEEYDPKNIQKQIKEQVQKQNSELKKNQNNQAKDKIKNGK